MGHEVNYGDRRDPARQVVPKPKKAATYVSRTYLTPARYDIERTSGTAGTSTCSGFR